MVESGLETRDAGTQDHQLAPRVGAVPLWAMPEAFQEFVEDGERDLVIEFMDLFLDGLPLVMQQLEQTCVTADADSALRVLHQLKGSSLQIGAERLGAIARKAESFVRNSLFEAGDSVMWLDGVRSCLLLTETEVRIRRDELNRSV